MLFQNKVARSSFALPVSVLFALAVLTAAYLSSNIGWTDVPELLWLAYCVPALVASTYCMMELNNRNVLLRFRSRMVSCSFLILTMMCPSIFAVQGVSFLQLCIVGGLFLLSSICQDNRSPGVIFYVFLLLGIASVVWVRVLWMIPVLLLLCVTLHSISWRALSAMIFGVSLPYYAYAVYKAWYGDYTWWHDTFIPLTDFAPFFRYADVTLGQLLTFILITVMTMIGSVHFLLYTYEDKIRVRVLLYTYMLFAWLLIIFIAMAPRFADYLLPMSVVPVSALIAHFFAHTSSRLSNITFITLLVLTLLTVIFNQCLTFLSLTVLGAS